MTDLAELHSFARIPPLTIVSPGPDLPVGSVGVIGTVQDTIDDFIAFPFQLQVNDWIVCINTPLDDASQTLVLTGCMVNAYNWSSDTDVMNPGVTPYRVTDVTGPVTIGTAGTSRCRVWLAVYRGVTETDNTILSNVNMQWIQGNSLLQATQASITYQAPAAQVVRVLYANAYAELVLPFSYNPSNLPYWTEETIGPTGNPAIDPDYEIYYAFFSGDDPSPTEEVQVSAPNASWDPKYDNGWGQITFHTFIFTTQTVLLLDYDPLNAGPAGSDRLPG